MVPIETVKILIAGILGLFRDVPPAITTFTNAIIDQLPILGSESVAFLQVQLAIVHQMIIENRDPTKAEWDALNAAVADELAKLNSQAKT